MIKCIECNKNINIIEFQFNDTNEIICPFCETVFKFNNVYIFECKDNKYYVTMSDLDSKTIVKELLCNFIEKYPIISIREKIPSCDPLDEDLITKKQMLKYGIDNVRGGSYSNIELEDWQIKSLYSEYNKIMKDKTHPNTIKTINNIDDEIKKLYKEIDEILMLKNNIKMSTLEMSTTDVNKIIDDLLQKTEGYKYNLQCITFQQQYRDHSKKWMQDKRNEIHTNLNHVINQKYEYCFQDTKYNDIEYLQLKILRIMNYNIEHKKKLNELLKKYGSDKIMNIILKKFSEKLVALYEKRIGIIS
jgi:hypothetical protein